MKILSAVILSCSLLSNGLLFSQEQEQPRKCACKNCQCTAQSHCGCFSNKGCTCGDNNSGASNCGCGGHLLGLNEFHHGNSGEHEEKESV